MAIGIPVALAAIALLVAVHELEQVVWNDVPSALGLDPDAPAGWYVVCATTLAGLLAALALRRSSRPVTHHLEFDPAPPRDLAWILTGALATLAGGIVLGPEAPLLVLGLGIAAAAANYARLEDEAARSVLVLAGAFIVLTALLSTPLPALVLMLEVVASSGRVQSANVIPSLIPGLVGSAFGMFVFTGVAGIDGIVAPTLTLPNLPAYDSVRLVDVAWTPLVAVAATAAVLASHRLAAELAPFARRAPLRATVALGAIIGLLAIAYRHVTDEPTSDVLFSGQTALPHIVALDSGRILLALVVCKGLAYACALTGLFEGGPIFPALAIASAVGVALALVLPGADLVPLLAVSIAASSAGLLRLPLFGMVFGLVVVGGATSLAVTPFAIFGAVSGWIAAVRAAPRAATNPH